MKGFLENIWVDLYGKAFYVWRLGGEGNPGGRKRFEHGDRNWHAQVPGGEGEMAWYGTSTVCWKVRNGDKILEGLDCQVREFGLIL